MNTLQDQWRQYRDKAYPENIPPHQNREFHQAFFAGALSALMLMDALATLPQDEPVKALRKLISEAIEVCAFRLETLKKQN